jgi:hypothetical protein
MFGWLKRLWAGWKGVAEALFPVFNPPLMMHLTLPDYLFEQESGLEATLTVPTGILAAGAAQEGHNPGAIDVPGVLPDGLD